MKTLWKMLKRDLLASRWLFLAITIVVVLGVALFGAAIMAFQNLRSSYDYSYDTLHFADFTVRVASAPTSVVGELEQVPGVQGISGRLNTDVGLVIPGESGHSLVARAISMPSDRHPAVNDIKVESGSYFSPGGQPQLLLEKNFAAYHHLSPGDSVTLIGASSGEDFTVAGVVTSPEYIFPAKSRNEFFVSPASWGVIFVPEEALAGLTGNNNINEFCVTLDKNAALETITGQFEEKLAPYSVAEVVPRDEQPSNAGLELDLQEFGEVAEIFPLLFLFVGAMTTYILIMRIIQRQRGQLGLMRALGYTRQQILIHYLSFALVIGIIGAVIGIIAGYFLADTITHLYIGFLGLPYTVTNIHWIAIEEGLFIGIIPSVIAGIFPAWAASRLQPAEAMRTPPPTAGRRPLLEKIFPFLTRLSLFWKIPLRNVFRNRRRSISTILGVVFGTVLILASAGFIDSMDSLFGLQFDKIQNYQARLSFPQPIPESQASAVTDWNGVNDVSFILEIPVTLENGANSFATLLVGMRPDTDLYGLYNSKGGREHVSAGRVLLARGIENRLDVKAGDTVTVATPFGRSEILVGGFVQQPMGSFGFITLDDARQLVGGQPIITGVLLATSGISDAALRDQASQQFGGVGIEITSEVESQFRGLLDLFYGILWIMLGFGAVLAAMVVFTMITVSLVERRREIATMRTLGEKPGRISAMITLENLILGIAGLVVGIPVGYAVTLYLVSFFQTDMFSFELIFYYRTYLITTGIIVIIMLLSQLPGIRSLNRLDLAKVTKEQVS